MTERQRSGLVGVVVAVGLVIAAVVLASSSVYAGEANCGSVWSARDPSAQENAHGSIVTGETDVALTLQRNRDDCYDERSSSRVVVVVIGCAAIGVFWFSLRLLRADAPAP